MFGCLGMLGEGRPDPEIQEQEACIKVVRKVAHSRGRTLSGPAPLSLVSEVSYLHRLSTERQGKKVQVRFGAR